MAGSKINESSYIAQNASLEGPFVNMELLWSEAASFVVEPESKIPEWPGDIMSADDMIE